MLKNVTGLAIHSTAKYHFIGASIDYYSSKGTKLTVSAPDPLLDVLGPHDRPLDRSDLLGHSEAVIGQSSKAQNRGASQSSLADAKEIKKNYVRPKT